MNLETHAKATELLEEIHDAENIINLLETSEVSYLRCCSNGRNGEILIDENLKDDLVSVLVTKKKQLMEKFKKL